MSLDKAMKTMKYDTRLLEFNLRTGAITKDEVKKHLEQLPDTAKNCEKLDLEDEGQGLDSVDQH